MNYLEKEESSFKSYKDKLGSSINRDNVRSIVLTESFFKIEEKITNSRLFWVLQFYPYNEASPENTRFTLDDWIKVFRRFDRLEIPLESRQGMGGMDKTR